MKDRDNLLLHIRDLSVKFLGDLKEYPLLCLVIVCIFNYLLLLLLGNLYFALGIFCFCSGLIIIIAKSIRVIIYCAIGIALMFYINKCVSFPYHLLSGGQVNVTARVTEVENSYKSKVKAKIIDSADTASVGMNIIADLPLYSDIRVNDTIRFYTLTIKKAVRFPDWYKRHLWREKVIAVGSSKEFEIIKSEANRFESITIGISKYFIAVVNRFLPEPHAGLFVGFFIGRNNVSFSQEFEESLQNSGTIHIVAVSGYNVSLVAMFFLSTAPFVGRKNSYVLAVFGLILFLFLAGITASVVRAVIMGIFVVLGKFLGRKALFVNSASVSFLIMFILNPLILESPSLLLSFSATIGLVYLTPYLNTLAEDIISRFGYHINRGPIAELVFAPVTALISVFPVMFVIFKQVSIVGIISNFLIVPLIPFIMGYGILAIIAAVLIPFRYFGHILFVPLYYMLEYIVCVIQFFGKFEAVKIIQAIPVQIVVIIFYAVLVYKVLNYHYCSNNDRKI